MPYPTIREVVAEGLGDTAKSVLCDGSATVTIVMKDDQKLVKDQIEKIFAASPKGKSWKASNFRRESRLPAVVRYEVGFSGST